METNIVKDLQELLDKVEDINSGLKGEKNIFKHFDKESLFDFFTNDLKIDKDCIFIANNKENLSIQIEIDMKRYYITIIFEGFDGEIQMITNYSLVINSDNLISLNDQRWINSQMPVEQYIEVIKNRNDYRFEFDEINEAVDFLFK